jgi:hypothetical protein
MLPTLRLLVLSALLALLYLPADLAAQTVVKPKKVCVGATGEFIARTRCKRGETTLTLPAVQQKLTETVLAGGPGPVGPTGPVGPAGIKGAVGNTGTKGAKGLIDFSGCRKVVQSEDNINGSVEKVSISAACVPGVEFIYDDQYKINIFGNSVGTKAVVQSRSPDNAVGDSRDYLVEYTMNRITLGGLGLYSVDLLILCCPL